MVEGVLLGAANLGREEDGGASWIAAVLIGVATTSLLVAASRRWIGNRKTRSGGY